MTPERKRELQKKYRRDVLGTSQEEGTRLYNHYLATLHVELDDHGRPSFHIFLALRLKARNNAYRADMDLVSGNITRRVFAQRLRKYCIDLYARELNRHGLATIDTDTEEWIRLRRRMTTEVVKAIEGFDPDDKDALCVPMAKTWHRFVSVVHARYGLPTVREMRRHVGEESDIERTVVKTDDFETRMTPQERSDIEADIE